MSIRSNCDFCRKKLKVLGGLLFSPPHSDGDVRKYHLCQSCFKRILRILKAGPKVIEDIVSLGPTWLNYTRKVKRKK